MGYRVKTLEIESFLGINEPLVIDFDEKTTLITGKNGVGKTSIMRAIEYALFGNVNEMSGSDYSRGRYELNNNFHEYGDARISLTLTDGIDETIIKRIKEHDSASSEIEYLEIEGEVIERDKERELDEWRGISENEFYLQGYLTQENFTQILEYTPKARSEAFNRLLNTEELQHINEEYTSTIKHFKSEKSTLEHELSEEKTQQLRDRINNKRNEVKRLKNEFSKSYPDYEFNNLLQVFNDAKSVLSNFDNIDNFQKLREVVNKEIKQVRSPTRSGSQDRITMQNYVDWLSQIKETREILELLEEQYNQYQEKLELYGSVKSLKNDKQDIEEKLLGIEDKLGQINKYTQFLKIAVDDILEDQDECPICDNEDFEVSKIKATLTNRIKDLKTENYDDYTGQKEKFKRNLSEIVDHIEELERFQQNIDQNYHTYLEEIEDLSNLLPDTSPWTNHSDFPELKFSNFAENSTTIKTSLQSLHDIVDERIGKFEEEKEKSSEQVGMISELINIRDICDETIKIKEEINSIEQLEEELARIKGDQKLIEDKIDSIDEIIEGLQEAQELVTDTQQEYIEQELSTLNPTIKQIYSIMEPHPHWSDMQIELQTKERTGTKSTYFDLSTKNPKDPDSVNLKAYFSRGQANRSILSLLLAIGSESSGSLNFQMLDDITQSLDGTITNNLSKTCAELSNKIQLIIGTADERFVESLRNEFDLEAITYNEIRLGEWTEKGTQIEQAVTK